MNKAVCIIGNGGFLVFSKNGILHAQGNSTTLLIPGKIIILWT